LWDYCEDVRYYEDFDNASWCEDNQDYCLVIDEASGEMYPDP